MSPFGNTGRISFFHPCFGETTKTTYKNNLSRYAVELARAFSHCNRQWTLGIIASGRGRVSSRTQNKLFSISCFLLSEDAAVNYADAPQTLSFLISALTGHGIYDILFIESVDGADYDTSVIRPGQIVRTEFGEEIM